MENDTELPVQVTIPSVKEGVTVIMASTGEVPVLVSGYACKMVPVPLAGIPIEGNPLFSQL